MTSDVEIERALAAVSATLNAQRPERFDRSRVHEIVTGGLGGEEHLHVDEGGGVHDDREVRVAALRRLGDGSWYVERQNFDAQNASSEIPTPSKLSTVRKLLTKLKVTG